MLSTELLMKAHSTNIAPSMAIAIDYLIRLVNPVASKKIVVPLQPNLKFLNFLMIA